MLESANPCCSLNVRVGNMNLLELRHHLLIENRSLDRSDTSHQGIAS
jgi:hypothetical protein